MPQFDTFIFSSSLFYFIISFFLLLYGNFTRYLPRLGSILKLRHKLTQKTPIIEDINLSCTDSVTVFACNLAVTDKA